MARTVAPYFLTEQDFWNKTEAAGACLIHTGFTKADGYGYLRYQGTLWLAHRLAWVFTHGPIPKGMLVLHHCDNPPCVCPAHLFLGTQIDNMADMKAKGRRKRINVGSRNGRAKLSEREVKLIRTLYATDRKRWLQAPLAARFGVSQLAISCIVLRKTWRHI